MYTSEHSIHSAHCRCRQTPKKARWQFGEIMTIYAKPTKPTTTAISFKLVAICLKVMHGRLTSKIQEEKYTDVYNAVLVIPKPYKTHSKEVVLPLIQALRSQNFWTVTDDRKITTATRANSKSGNQSTSLPVCDALCGLVAQLKTLSKFQTLSVTRKRLDIG